MTSFEELKNRALDLAQSGVAKAKVMTDVAKLNIANTTEEDAIKRAYIEIGKLYYAERGMAPEAAYVALCEKITAAKTRIEENNTKISDIKKANASVVDVDSTDCGCGCNCGCETEVPPEEPKDPDEQ
ncbi:MAG: serine proteinase [Intestinimonas sp.]|jgi:hypothetical protein|nr:serine proteinase [Intestinimonas sp.]